MMGVVRVVAGLACVALIGVAAILMLSDRAPGALRSLSDRIDQSERPAARLASESPVPQSDVVVHVGVWAMVTATAGIAAWSWRRLAVVVALALAAGMAIELAQGRLTRSRNVELADVSANLAGVALGAVVVAICYTLYLLAHAVRHGRAGR
jgi:VanZ family protein